MSHHTYESYSYRGSSPAMRCVYCGVDSRELRASKPCPVATELAEAAAVAPPSAQPADTLCAECGTPERSSRHHMTDGSRPNGQYLHAFVAPPETTAPTATDDLLGSADARLADVIADSFGSDPSVTEREYRIAAYAVALGFALAAEQTEHTNTRAAVSPVASSATPTPEPESTLDRLARISRENDPCAARLASSQQEVERLRAALDRIQASGFAWAGEEGDAYGFDARSTKRIEALATIAVEALHPKTEADEMDCRSIPR